MIRPLQGSDLSVPRIPECEVCEWTEGGYRVVFSYARQGPSISAHFAADKDSLREVKTAINDFVEMAFRHYNYCQIVTAVVGRKSIERIVKKCGFEFLTEREGYQVYARTR